MIIFLKPNYRKALEEWYISNRKQKPTYQVVITPADKLKLKLGVIPDELNVFVYKVTNMSPAPSNKVIINNNLYALYKEGGRFKLKKENN